MIFSDPGGELIDQVLENLLAFAAPATAHAVNLHNVPSYLWDRVLKESLARQPWHQYLYIVFLTQESDLFGCSPHTSRYWVVFVWRPGGCWVRIPRSRKRCLSISSCVAGRVSVASLSLESSVSSTSADHPRLDTLQTLPAAVSLPLPLLPLALPHQVPS